MLNTSGHGNAPRATTPPGPRRSRTRARYGSHAERYVHLEAGHAAQNVLLEATALGLGAVPVGAFDDDAVRAAISASADETPLYILAVGHPER
jgi:nitroreductase